MLSISADRITAVQVVPDNLGLALDSERSRSRNTHDPHARALVGGCPVDRLRPDVAVSVARVATFDEPPVLREDHDRRAQTLYELLKSLPGFVAGYYLREPATGREADVGDGMGIRAGA